MSGATYKHITIKRVGVTGRTSKPKYAVCTNKDDIALGYIEYYQQWRKYIFAPSEDSVFDAECLKNILDFIETQAGKL